MYEHVGGIRKVFPSAGWCWLVVTNRWLVDVVAHMILASLLEVALLVARADEDRLSVKRGQAAVDELLTALLAPR